MKLLNGQELADYIKERQARTVRRLSVSNIVPKLVIIHDNESPVIMKYIRLKQAYGKDIGVTVEVKKVSNDEEAREIIQSASVDNSVHGIIVQLPLKTLEDDTLRSIDPKKDVDGLNGGMPSATAEAINWLLGGYNIDLSNKKIALVGYGKLVGKPLAEMWRKSDYDITIFRHNDDLYDITIFRHNDDLDVLRDFDLVVSATGSAGLIKSKMLKPGAIVVDAGTASEDGVLKGDVDEAVRAERDDLVITPKIGGVGPLTVALLFEHVLMSAENK